MGILPPRAPCCQAPSARGTVDILAATGIVDGAIDHRSSSAHLRRSLPTAPPPENVFLHPKAARMAPEQPVEAIPDNDTG